MTKKKTVTIHDDHTGRSERVSLPQPLWKGSRRLRAGVTITALYYGPHSHRCFMGTHSSWQDAKGYSEGTMVREVSLSSLLKYAEHCSVTVPFVSVQGVQTKRTTSKKAA